MRLYRWSKLGGNRKICNLTLSNVPGPQAAMLFDGRDGSGQVRIFYGAGLNITVMSLNGSLDAGLVSCSDLLPDLWDLADGLRPALKELLDAAS
jgi:diacylglycerol O-acyltransferase